jgi:hypothetical protein
MYLNYLPSVNFGTADILTLSHYLDKMLLALSEPYENGVRYFFESSNYMYLLLHLHLAQENHVNCIDYMKLV